MVWSQHNIISILPLFSFILAVKCCGLLGCSLPSRSAKVPTGKEVSLKKSYQQEIAWGNAWLSEHTRSIKRTQLLLSDTLPPLVSDQASLKNEEKILQNSANGLLGIIADANGQSLPIIQLKNSQGKTSSLILESLCHNDSCSLDAIRVHPKYPWVALLFNNQEGDANVFLARWNKNGAISIKTFSEVKNIYDISWEVKENNQNDDSLVATTLEKETPLNKVVLWGSTKIEQNASKPIYFKRSTSTSYLAKEQTRQFPLEPKSQRTGLISIGYGAYGAPVRLPSLPLLSLLARDGYLVYRTKIAGDNGRAVEGQGLGKLRSAADYVAETRTIAEKYNITSRQTVALARSAGAIPVLRGVATAPHLFCAVVLEVPFIDPYALLKLTKRAHHPSVPIFSPDEKAEWLGRNINSEQSIQRKILKKISLLTSPPIKLLPPILVISAEDDERAPVNALVKFFSYLRRKQTLHEESRIIMFGKKIFSHEGPRNRATSLNYQAIIKEFIKKSCGK